MALLLLNWQRFALYGVVVLAVCSAVWLHGYSRGERKLWDYQTEQAKAAVAVVVKQGAASDRIVVKWRTRVEKVKGETEVIEKEVVRYVPARADPVLPLGWVFLHNAAALGTVPPPTARIDVAAPTIAASDALKGVVTNYGTCRETAEQLTALQEWVREQYQVMNLQPLRY